MAHETADSSIDGRSVDRRRFLKVAGAIGVTGLAGCGGDGGDDDTPTDASTPTDTGAPETTTEAATPTDTPTDTDTRTATPTDTPGQPLDDPASLLSIDSGSFVPGESVAVAGAITNPYLFDVTDVEVTLDAPEGWEVEPTGPTEFDTLGSQSTEETGWEVTVPDGAAGENTLTATVSYASATDEAEVPVTHEVFVVNPADFEEGLGMYLPLDEAEPIDRLTGEALSIEGDPETGVEGVIDGAVRTTENGQALVAESVPINGETATVTCWVRFTDFEDYARVLYFGDASGLSNRPSSGVEFQFRPQDEGTRFETQVLGPDLDGGYEVGQPDQEVPVEFETWYFAAIVMDGDETRFHTFDLDGELEGSPRTATAARGRTDPENTAITLMHGDGNVLFGRIDEVRGYTRALSESEVGDLYQDGLDASG